ncbi:tryptophan 7-halogenase [Allosphingosinicella flava]|uniref:Tryptophan 7-halogenase n=1 Tax=Allosphingosinicella flava TaxID=2771430 RepID=A0A7T2LLT7_9SPHN|nr:tryptophan halogenase family protein [Sphingosinicella flava]QPQ54367.1 tryptophan 7-halogenase [Sphingosinicella flava]
MEGAVTNVVIVGGGTAGWLSACLIAAQAASDAERPIAVTLIESPDVPTIGVGEGTWPTMRGTLDRIGIDEADFLVACDASFKQGSRFDGWATGGPDDIYYHPFTAPVEGDARALVKAWRVEYPHLPFADAVGAQSEICRQHLAPRQRAMPPYAGALNYAYHLDAAKLAALLARHGREKLGIRYISDHVTGVEAAEDGDITAVRTRENGSISGDLFIDCTGHAALLIGAHCGVPFIDRSDVLFNDRALAAQVAVAPGSPIASQTNATAHEAGWLWDIGLPTRRGIGCVYSSSHMTDDEAAETLRTYVRDKGPEGGLDGLTFRQLRFRSGHRERFWDRNCLAIGLSAGFLEPLEASAIVMIELSLNALLANFPADRSVMDIHAKRFNDLFRYRWDRIVEFLKLHYVPSRRDGAYWRDHRAASSIPDRLADLLAIWKHQPPSIADLPAVDEIFPAASYQYVLYGIGFPPPAPGAVRTGGTERMMAAMAQTNARTRALSASLPTNRAYLDALRAAHAQGETLLETM